MREVLHNTFDAFVTLIAQAIVDKCFVEIDRRKEDQRREQHSKFMLPKQPMSESVGGERPLKLTEVQRRVALSRSSIYLMVNEGRFPKPIKIGKRAVAWSEAGITHWMATKSTIAVLFFAGNWMNQ